MATATFTGTGNWDDATGKWSGGGGTAGQPTAADAAVLAASSVCTLNIATAVCDSLTSSSSGQLAVDGTVDTKLIVDKGIAFSGSTSYLNLDMSAAPTKKCEIYWNNDNTRLPAAFHSDLIDFFKHNPLTRPRGLEVCGSPVDLQKVTVDSFSVAGINDHITPWDAVYRSTLLLGGNRRFILSNSGHIQSILNPPGNPKSNYLENPALGHDAKAWYEDAEQVQGSWWPVWLEWIQQRSGEQRPTLMALGNQHYPAMEAAPGTYVHVR